MLRHAEEFVLLNELTAARRRTDALFALAPDTLLYERPILDQHRLVFYLGHLDAFEANLLLRQTDRPKWLPARRASRPARAREIQQVMNERFAVGSEALDGSLPQDTRDEWPMLSDIRGYLTTTRRQLGRHIASNVGRNIDGVPLSTLLHAAIEHRLMLAETLACTLNRLAFERPVRLIAPLAREFSNDDMVSIPAGNATLGARTEQHAFVWDHECEPQRIEVPAFGIDRHMVTNGQFLCFVEEGGYTHRRWWNDEDWQWRESHHGLHPAAWRVVEGEWCVQSLYDLVPLQSDWPVHVSHAEATAYANWCGKQLPSEAQWQRAAYGSPDEVEWPYPWGSETPGQQHGNVDFARWDPVPVDAHPAGRSAFGVVGMLGNGWEWTSTRFAPFEGFVEYDFYRGHAGDRFDGRHVVLKGGSMHTASRLLRHSFRHSLRRHDPYACAGFRCVCD